MITRKRTPAHPGRILKNHYLKPLDLSITEVAANLKVSRKTISKIANEHGDITPDMALRLSIAFNTSPELWLNLQLNYDLWHASNDSKAWKRVRVIETEISQAAIVDAY